MLWWGSPFTAMHICALYITLGVGVDDAFIIAAAIHSDDNKEPGKSGLEETKRQIKRGMARCGPSILLTYVPGLARATRK
jgi:hypothetical protein